LIQEMAIAVLGFVLVVFFCVTYCLGGQGYGKWIRRYLGPGVFGAGIILISYLHHNFGILSVLAGGWYIPSLVIFKYGVNDGSVAKKIALRAVYGGSLGLCGLLAGIAGHHPWLGVFQLISAVSATVYFGVRNPFSKYSQQIGNWATILEDGNIIISSVAMVPFIL